jgi:heme/copper-type cytochrome/quinol oxidase subunit 2
MNPKTLKILIIGLALMIFGPVIGWVLTIAGFFHTATAMQQIQPGVMPDFQQTSSRMMSSIIPILIGVVLGAIGFFLFLYSLITHFFRSKP